MLTHWKFVHHTNTHRGAEERKMIEAKTEEILAKDGNGKKEVVDSEPYLEQEQNSAAKQKAKVAMEKPIGRTAKPKLPKLNGRLTVCCLTVAGARSCNRTQCRY